MSYQALVILITLVTFVLSRSPDSSATDAASSQTRWLPGAAMPSSCSSAFGSAKDIKDITIKDNLEFLHSPSDFKHLLNNLGFLIPKHLNTFLDPSATDTATWVPEVTATEI